MTPKEQAENIVNKFENIEFLKDFEGMYRPLAIACAKICVQFIINSNPQSNPFNNEQIYSTMNYWLKVKKEIEKL